MKMRFRSFGLVALVAAASFACTQAGEQTTGTVRFELQKAASCEHLLGMLRDDAKAKVNGIAADLAEQGPFGGYYFGGGSGGASAAGGSGGTSSGGAAGGGGNSGAPPPKGHSETNTQVAGVDEADIVKTDGEHLYLLHGEELYVLDSWPAQSIGIEKSIGIEGQPFEMFVEGGKAVVFSRVHVDAPPKHGESQGSPPGGGGGAAGSGPGMPSPHYYGNFTKITVIDVTSEQPTVLRESYVEGEYRSSRRHENTVRAIVTGGFASPPEIWDTSFEWDDYQIPGYDYSYSNPHIAHRGVAREGGGGDRSSPARELVAARGRKGR
jgi:hypothetical protein